MLELYKSLYTVLSARATTQIFIKIHLELYKVQLELYKFLLLAIVNSLRDVPPSNSIAGRQSVLSVGSDNLVEASMNEHIRVHVQQRSRVPVPLHDPPLSALLLPHHEGPRQRHLAPLLRQCHRERRPPPEDKVRRMVPPPLQVFLKRG